MSFHLAQLAYPAEGRFVDTVCKKNGERVDLGECSDARLDDLKKHTKCKKCLAVEEGGGRRWWYVVSVV